MQQPSLKIHIPSAPPRRSLNPEDYRSKPTDVEIDGRRCSVAIEDELELRADHANYPMWVTSGLIIYVENWDHPQASRSDNELQMAQPIIRRDFISEWLLKIAEPRARPDIIHTYEITLESLHTAASGNDLKAGDIVAFLAKYNKFVSLPEKLVQFVNLCSERYCKVRLLLQRSNHYVVSETEKLLKELLRDRGIKDARYRDEWEQRKGFERISMIAAENDRQGDAGQDGVDAKGNRKRKAARLNTLERLAAWPPAFMHPDDLILKIEQDDTHDTDGSSSSSSSSSSSTGILKDDTRLAQRNLPCFKLRETTHRGDLESVRAAARAMDLPLVEEYDFEKDFVNRPIMVNSGVGSEEQPYSVRPDKKLRNYQKAALHRMFGSQNKVRSGIIVLPCGSGKTFLGIAAAVRIGRSCIVVCNNNAAADQWARAFREFTNIEASSLIVFTSDQKPAHLPKSCVLISTYDILKVKASENKSASETGIAAAATRQAMAAIRGDDRNRREWALMVLDEVHMAPANIFKTVMEVAKCHCKLGLTATLVREDEKIDDLFHLIGPRLYEANWTELAQDGHLATVQCFEVWCPMTRDIMAAYYDASNAHAKEKLARMNPAKFRAAEFLLEQHRARRDQILLFSDDIKTLETYAQKMNIPNLRGESQNYERDFWLSCFRCSGGDDGQESLAALFSYFVFKKRNNYQITDALQLFKNCKDGEPLDEKNKELKVDFTRMWRNPRSEWDPKFLVSALALSRVGDIAIDLPDANVLIQVVGDGGGRRQEAQRMGRILRKKTGESQDAMFYSLISRDTTEVIFGQRRQRYLIEQGYSYEVRLVDDLLGGWQSKLLPENSSEEQNMISEAIEYSRNSNIGRGSGSKGGRRGNNSHAKSVGSNSNAGPSSISRELYRKGNGGGGSIAIEKHLNKMKRRRVNKQRQEAMDI